MSPHHLNAILNQTRQQIYAAPDQVCLERARLVTQAYQQFADDPPPLRRAKAFAHVLDQMSLDLETNPIFAGNTSTGVRRWMLLPEYGFEIPAQALIENTRLEGLLDGPVIPEDIRAYWHERAFGGAAGWGHLAVDHRLILEKGLAYLLQQAESYSGESGSPQAVYRQAMAISLRAVIHWAGRYAQAAQTAAQTTHDPLLAALHQRVAEACHQVPSGPARNLFEALQSLILVHLAMHIEGQGYSVSLGRLDQLLQPYDRDDPDTVELLAAFMLKLYANSLWGSHSKTQPITLGGVNAFGQDASNPLTLKILEAWELAGVPDPIIFLRWHSQLPAGLKNRAVTMLASGRSMPLLAGDEQTISGLVQAGVSPEDAAEYCIVGCNELGIPGRMIYDNLILPEVRLLRDAVCDPNHQIDTMEDLLDELQARARTHLRAGVEQKLAAIRRSVAEVPTPFTSALMEGCLQQGRDHYDAMPYPHINILSMGFANLVNGLSSISAVVFEKHLTSLSGLGLALENNFAGAEALRRALLNAPRWGADDARADCWALGWMERRRQILAQVSAEAGRPLMMELVVRSLHHLHGRGLGATPDGRLTGEPLSDSIGAPGGVGLKGPTALLNSVCRLRPAEFWQGGYNFNLTLPLAGWQQPGMDQLLESLVEVFFSGGGQELQINSLDVDTLLDAQRNPGNYPNLMVRIAGFNARFIDLSALEQGEIIQRARAAVQTAP